MRCQGGKSGDRLVLREYLVYRLYNILTDKSYQVQLIQATFEDSLKADKTFQTYGFLIEPTKENWCKKLGGHIRVTRKKRQVTWGKNHIY